MDRRAAIITPYGLFNYGNRLQNYAVTQLLSQRGIKSDTIVINGITRKTGWIDYAKGVVWNPLNPSKRAQRYRAFQQFDSCISKKNISIGQLNNELSFSEYFYAVIGSDQIWNPFQINQCETVYGSFVPAERRVCISPSFGIDEIPQGLESLFSLWLKEIQWLSVRELSGRDIVRKLTGKDCPVLIDPTMAIGIDSWDLLASTRLCPDNPYIFVYVLGKKSLMHLSDIRKSANRQDLDVVELTNRDSYYFTAGPNDFIGLLKNAESVITDSFHASAFALLYGKPLHIVIRAGESYSMHNRLMTLQSLFGLEDVFATDYSDLRQSTYDLERVLDEIRVQKLLVDDFLDCAFAINRE